MTSSEITPETTRKSYQNLIENHPEIAADGYMYGTPDFASARVALLDHYGAFVASVGWIQENLNFDREKTSYGLKHEAERATGVYIPNGVFILAALHMRIEISHLVPDSPNVRFA